VSSGSASASASEPAARIPVDLRRFPWVKRLAADYAYDFGSIASFYSGDPAAHASWGRAIARTRDHVRPRAEIAAIVSAQQRKREAPRAAVEAAARLSDPRTVAVVTGQQAGLFGGPLYTLLKALTALKLAELVARDHDVPIVAVFWVDAEDHDWDEVRGCTVFDADLEPHAIALPPRTGSEAAPAGAVRLDEAVAVALTELDRVLPQTDFKPALLDRLRHAYAPGVTMADAFGCWLEHVLGDRGLIVVNAGDPAAKPLVASLFAREVTTAGQTSRLARSAGADLAARGYHSQVQVQDDALAVFHLDGARRAIRQQDGAFLVGDERYVRDRLVEAATQQPDTFSPNVLLRPVVQDSLFPTVAYVAGPSELAYLGQLRTVYEHFGVPMPLMYPRATATLVDSAALRFLTKYRVPLEALQPQDEAALNELLKAQMPSEIEESFAQATAAMNTAMSQVIAALPQVDPTLEGAGRSTLSRMQHDLETLHGKLVQAAKRRNETLRRQFLRARALTFPNGHPQERVIGFVSFLNQYGPALIERLDEEIPLDIGRHWIVAI
jgi:bacillithiol synthase